MQSNKTKNGKDPLEFVEWMKDIKNEIKRVRGIDANYTDIKREMTKQFKGKFIV